jgi:xanthine dehydrogenase accessory factor
MINFSNIHVWIRGAGELGSAIANILHKVGFSVFLSELENPLAIRRTVTYSDTIYNNIANVEDTFSKLCTISELSQVLADGFIPVLVDKPNELKLHADIHIDARLLKKGQEDLRHYALYSIGLGPGFDTNINCDTVIETMRGHDLGRVITNGTALPNTNIPGLIGGESKKRIIRAIADGQITWHVNFGNLVKQNDILGSIDDLTITAPFDGIVRGLIAPSVSVYKGMKIGDLDPRGKQIDITHISDKSRTIARGVLEAILINNRK